MCCKGTGPEEVGVSRRIRLVALFILFALTGAACAIEPPQVVLTSAGGGEGSGQIQLGPAGEVEAEAEGQVSEVGGGTTLGQGGQAASGVPCEASDEGVSKTAIKLGSTFALSGPVKDISGPIKDGVLAYVQEVNAAGGIDFGSCKRKINFVWYDDGWDAQNGKAKITKLVKDDKVFALATVPSSNGLTAATPDLERWGVPVIGSSGLNEDQFFSPVIFPIGASTATSTHIGLRHVKENLGAQTVAIVYLEVLAGEYAIEAFRHAAQQFGMQITSERNVSVSERNYDAVWARIRQDTLNATGNRTDTPDYVTLAIDPSSAIVAMQSLGRQRTATGGPWRPSKGVGGGPPLFFDLVPQQAGRNADRLGAQSSYIPALPQFMNRPAVKQYVDTLRKYAGSSIDPLNPYLEGGYLGMALTVEAIQRAGPNPTRKGVIEALESMTDWTNGLSQPLTYRPIGTENGHRGNLNVMNFEVRFNGDAFEWVPVTQFMTDPFPQKKYEV